MNSKYVPQIGDLLELHTGETVQVILDSETLNKLLVEAHLFAHTVTYFLVCKPEEFGACVKLPWRKKYFKHSRPDSLYIRGIVTKNVARILTDNKTKKHLLRRD